MEFTIGQNSTLPLLKLQVVKNGIEDFNSMMEFIERSSIFFSMVDTTNGISKINTKVARFVEKLGMDVNASPEYYVYYQFTSQDTSKVGRYEGQFVFINDTGTLVLPIRESLYINIKESYIANDLPYNNCYVLDYNCCTTPFPSQVPTQTPYPILSQTPTPTPTPTPTSSITPTPTPTSTTTPTPTPTNTPTNTPTPTSTTTPTPTPTNTPTNTPTPTSSPLPPINQLIPLVSGENSVGSILTTTNGTWSNNPTSFSYQWFSTPYTGGSSTLILSANSISYLLVQNDANNYIYCEVTATNLCCSVMSSSDVNSNYIYDANYYMIYSGYTLSPPSVGQSILQNQLMVGLKSIGVWNKLDYLIVCATDGDEYFSLINWKTNTQLSFSVGGYTFIPNQGFQLDGISGYIDTQFNPSISGVQYQLISASRYFMPYSVTSGVFDGIISGSFINSIQLSNTVNQKINQTNNNLTIPFEYLNDPSGLKNTPSIKSIHRIGINNIRLYNGTTASVRNALVTSVLNSNQFIGRSGTNYGNHIVSGYAMGANMISQNTAFVNLWNTYINAI